VTTELDRVRERVRQKRAARARSPVTVRGPAEAAPMSGGNGLAAGAKAFDLLTGEHVEVVGGYRENVVIPTSER